jgi:hypothetical protein
MQSLATTPSLPPPPIITAGKVIPFSAAVAANFLTGKVVYVDLYAAHYFAVKRLENIQDFHIKLQKLDNLMNEYYFDMELKKLEAKEEYWQEIIEKSIL